MFDKLKLFVSDKMQALRYRMITEQLYRAGYDESGRFFYYYTFENNTTCYMCTDVYTHYVYMYNINGNWDIYYDPSADLSIRRSGMLYDNSIWCGNFVDYIGERYANIAYEEENTVLNKSTDTRVMNKDRHDSRVIGMSVNLLNKLRMNSNRLAWFYNSDMDHYKYANKLYCDNIIKKYKNNLDKMTEEEKNDFESSCDILKDYPKNRMYVKFLHFPEHLDDRSEVYSNVETYV